MEKSGKLLDMFNMGPVQGFTRVTDVKYLFQT